MTTASGTCKQGNGAKIGTCTATCTCMMPRESRCLVCVCCVCCAVQCVVRGCVIIARLAMAMVVGLSVAVAVRTAAA